MKKQHVVVKDNIHCMCAKGSMQKATSVTGAAVKLGRGRRDAARAACVKYISRALSGKVRP